jgi:hypothetical protein
VDKTGQERPLEELQGTGVCMSWDELDALAGQLRTLLDAGAFTGLGPIAIHSMHQMDVEQWTRLTLADVDHVRWEESVGVSRFYISERKRGLIADIQQILRHVEAADGHNRLSDEETDSSGHQGNA